jgi:hypothetical protein
MDHARQRGAARIDLNTSVDDVAARALYESAGFTNREGGAEGPQMLYYERDLQRAPTFGARVDDRSARRTVA